MILSPSTSWLLKRKGEKRPIRLATEKHGVLRTQVSSKQPTEYQALQTRTKDDSNAKDQRKEMNPQNRQLGLEQKGHRSWSQFGFQIQHLLLVCPGTVLLELLRTSAFSPFKMGLGLTVTKLQNVLCK